MSIFDFFKERKEGLDRLAAKRSSMRKQRSQIKVQSRIEEVLDPATSTLLFEDIKARDPLNFPGYQKKLNDLVRRSGLNDAFKCATGTIQNHRVVCAELVPEFLMGSMGTAVGEAICRSIEYAQEKKLPLIIFSASGGARMQEGMFSLMQMAKTSAALRRFSDAGGLYISVLTHPTTGGVTASFASLGDVIIAEPGALIGFAGPRVIEQTIRTSLPEGFQSAEFQQRHGFVDLIAPREELRGTLARILALHAPKGSPIPQKTGNENRLALKQRMPGIKKPGIKKSNRRNSNTKKPSEHVGIARHQNRPHARAFIDELFEEFIELHGDRHFGDDASLIAGIACFGKRPVTIAAHLKGSDLTENLNCNFGMPHPEGYRKFIRLAKQAEKFGRPLITFIDTPGAYPGAEAEERGQGEAIAQCLFELSGLKVPTIAIITGEGGSGGALALGVADRVYMYEYAIYSVLSPEGFASILWKDAKRADEAAAVMKLTAHDLLDFKMIDGIIAEPSEGAHTNALASIKALKPVIEGALTELEHKSTETLLAERYEKYRKFQ